VLVAAPGAMQLFAAAPVQAGMAAGAPPPGAVIVAVYCVTVVPAGAVTGVHVTTRVVAVPTGGVAA
jgi:hypothetical protein